MTDIDLAGLEITEQELREIQEAWDARRLRLQHPCVFDLIKALAPYSKLKRSIVLDMLWRTHKNAGLPIPHSFDESVQASMQYYCRDSDKFKKRNAPPEDALFCWPEGKGKGVWELLRDNARVWVRANRETLAKRVLGG